MRRTRRKAPVPLLTQDQRRALASDRHISVTANAGTGKTTVLVERYLELLHTNAALPSAIVVVTFTEKAAGELKLRIADRLAAEAAAMDAEKASQLQNERRDLAGAFIGTIHAFCAHTLREFPVEAGVDASFGVIEGLDQRLMLAEAVHETLRRVARDATPGPMLLGLQDLLHEKGRGELYRIITTLVEHRGILEQLTGHGGLYSRSDSALLKFWRDALLGQLDGALRDPFLFEAIARLTDIASGRSSAAVKDLFQDLKNATDLSGRVVAYNSMASLMLRKDGRMTAAFRGNSSERSAAAMWEAAFLAQHRGIAPLLPLVLAPREAAARQRDLLRASRLLLALAQEAMERYEQQKLATARLDFEDLLLRTKYLLRNEAVRRRLAERYRYIMVDEYQDTNLLQYEILLPLVDNLRTGNLFIVGDPKQSIYAFRGADVAVFERTRNDIASVAGPGADLLLAQSFRPLRDVAAFVNVVFSGAMTGGEFDVHYDALIRARNNNAPGRVELLLANPDEQEGISEAESIARRILMLRAEHMMVFDHSEQARPMRFGDIGVLLRSRALLPALEAALIRYRIPYTVTAGTGFFQTQEVSDLYSYLRFLTYPEDDVAFIALLRSPFFAVSDADLFTALHDRPPGSLWSFLTAPEASASSSPLAEAVRILQEDLQDSARFPVHELIARVVDRTHYAAKHAGMAWGEQTAANLEKLQELARAFGRQGFVGLWDFVARLRSLIEEELNEGQGVAPARGDAVQVMTVHAAKGQEFPIVILPRLHATTQSDREPFIDPFWGVGLTPPVLEGAEEEDPPLTGFLRVQNRRRAQAEEKRVFYVACTRARDILILSAESIETGGRETPMSWVAAALEITSDELPPSIERNVSTGVLLQKESGQTVVQEEHPLHIPLLRGASLPLLVETRGALSSVSPLSSVAVEPVSSVPHGETYDLEEIATYTACPYLYYRLYRLALPPVAAEEMRNAAAQCRSWLHRTALWHASQRAIEKRDAAVVTAPVAGALLSVACERLFVQPDGQAHIVVVPALFPGLVSALDGGFCDVLTGIVSVVLSLLEKYRTAQLHIACPETGKKCRLQDGSVEEDSQRGTKIVQSAISGMHAGNFRHSAEPCPVCTRLARQRNSQFTSSTL